MPQYSNIPDWYSELDREAYEGPRKHRPGRGNHGTHETREKGIGNRQDGLCHIDGRPCPRAARCNEGPYMVCAHCIITKNVGYSFTMCRRCAKARNGCSGFKCLLRHDHKGGKSILLNIGKNKKGKTRK